MKVLMVRQWLVRAVATVFIFMLTSGVSYAKTENSVGSINIPGNFGEVKEKFEGTSEKTVIHIQDAHCNYDAQINISNIIKELVAENQINLVAVEGAKGEVDTQILASIPDERVKDVVSDYFVRNGDITGADLASAVLNGQIDLYGVENKEQYVSNRKAFVETLQKRGLLEEKTAKIEWLLVQLKERIFSAEAKELFAAIEDYAKDRIPLSRYCVYLKSIAEEKSVNLSAYSNFAQIVEIVNMEETIDFSRVETERLQVVESLEAKLSKDEVSNLVSKSLYFRLGKVSAKDYYNYLNEMIDKAELDIKEYTNLSTYIKLVNLYEKVNSDKLFDELESLENSIKDKVYQTPAEKELDTFFRNIEVLSNLCSLKMTRKDLDYYNNNKESFKIEKFVSFIRKQMIKFNLSFPIDSELAVIEQVVPALENFYNIALKRDQIMVSNLLNRMNSAKKDSAILITGGFHSKGVLDQLKEKNISYMVVMPKINSLGDTESIYLNRISGGAYTAMSGVALNFLQTPNNLSLDLVGTEAFVAFSNKVVTAVTAVGKSEESVSVGLLKDSATIGEQFKAVYAEALAKKNSDNLDLVDAVFQESLPAVKLGKYVVCSVKETKKSDGTVQVLTYLAKLEDGKLVGLENINELNQADSDRMAATIAETITQETNGAETLSIAANEFTVLNDIAKTLTPENAAAFLKLVENLTPVLNMARMNSANLEMSEVSLLQQTLGNNVQSVNFQDNQLASLANISTQLQNLEGYNVNLGTQVEALTEKLQTEAAPSNVDAIANFVMDIVRSTFGENLKDATNIGTIKSVSDFSNDQVSVEAAADMAMNITFADETQKGIFAFRTENQDNIDIYLSQSMMDRVNAGDKEAMSLFANAIAEELLEVQGHAHDLKNFANLIDSMQDGINALTNNLIAANNVESFRSLYTQLDDVNSVDSQTAEQKAKVSDITSALQAAVVDAVVNQSELLNADAVVYKLLGSEDILIEMVKDGSNTPEKVRAEVENILADKGVLNAETGKTLNDFVSKAIASAQEADASIQIEQVGTVNPLLARVNTGLSNLVDSIFTAKLENSFANLNTARTDAELDKFEKTAAAGKLHITLAKALNLRLENGQVKFKDVEAVAGLLSKYKGTTVYLNRSEIASILGVDSAEVTKEMEPIISTLTNAGVKIQEVSNLADMLGSIKDANDYVMVSEFEGNKNAESVKAFNQSGKIDVLGDNISVFKVADYVNNALSLKLDDFREARVDFIMDIFDSVGIKKGSEEWHSIRKNLEQAKDALIYITAVPLGKLSTEEINFDHITETSLALYA